LNWLKIVAFAAVTVAVLPILFLLFEGLGPLRDPAGYGPQVFSSILLTIVSSAIAVGIEVVVFTPAAYYFARNPNSVLETVSDLPASVPHPIIGVALLLIDSPLTPTGKFLDSLGINFFDTLTGLVVALVVISTPVYIKAVEPFFASMNESHESFAKGLGASELRTYASVVIPNSLRGVLSASLISLSRSMSEFGSIAIIAYSVFSVYPAPVLIYQYFSSTGLSPAITASAVMILVGLALMAALRVVNAKLVIRP